MKPPRLEAKVSVAAALSKEDLDRIKQALAESQNLKKKDIWDKIGISGVGVAGALIAALLTYRAHRDDILLSNRKAVTDYIELSKSETDPKRRTDLLDTMELALTPDEAVKMAIHYAYAPYSTLQWPGASLKDQSDFNSSVAVSDEALEVLRRLKGDEIASEELRKISKNTVASPDREIAKGILQEPSKTSDLWIRMSGIDDIGYLFVFPKRVVPKYSPLDCSWDRLTSLDGLAVPDSAYRTEVHILDSPQWLQITGLVEGPNTIYFYLWNTMGPCSGRFQVSVGTQQFDTGPYSKTDCPEGFIFGITMHLTVDHGAITLVDRNPSVNPALDSPGQPNALTDSQRERCRTSSAARSSPVPHS